MSSQPEGLLILQDFISSVEEAALAQELLHRKAPWLDKAHLRFSNTKQQEFGPRVSDMMQVITDQKPSSLPPLCLRLAKRVAAEAKRFGVTGAHDMAVEGKSFLRVNHYNAVGGGYMHKHMDSQKCFGPVIACCSLLADASMNFYDTQGNSFGMAKVHRTAEVFIPRRSLYFMTGPSRYQWQHGIRKDQCTSERLSLTFRTVRADAPTTLSKVVLSEIQQRKGSPVSKGRSPVATVQRTIMKRPTTNSGNSNSLLLKKVPC